MKSTSNIHSLRAGVIGTGFIGPVHVEALRRLGVPVVAICDVADLARTAAAKLAIPQAFADYRQMLACPEVDVVHITTPNRFHAEMSLAALRAGKHVICEKPLAMNTRETAQIVKAVRATGRVFAVNYNVRFYPAVLQLHQLVQRGQLGDIIHVNGSYLQDWLFKDTDYNWRLLPQEGGTLRAVADIGTHWMDTLSFILGAKKSAWWSSEEPELLHFGNRDGANETAVRATSAFGDGAVGFMDYPPGHVEGFPDTFKMNFRAIYSAIAGADRGLYATAADGHQEVAVCEAIIRSNQSQSWVKVSS